MEPPWTAAVEELELASVKAIVAAHAGDADRLARALVAARRFVHRASAEVAAAHRAADRTHDAAELQRRRAEELAARRAAVIEASIDAIIGIDHTDTIYEFNRAAEGMFGYRREDILGKPLGESLVSHPFRRAHAEAFGASSHGILGKRRELTAQRADGSEFPIEITVTEIPFGPTPHFKAFIRDLSETRRIENALHQKERMLSAILAGIHEAVMFVDARGQVMFRNRAAEAVVRQVPALTPYHLDGTRCLDAELPITRALRGEDVSGIELLLGAPDPVHATVLSVSAAPIRNATGAIEGAVASYRDITSRWRLEEEQRRAADLEERNRVLQQATRTKSEFLANMSHELRTPLNAIIGLAQLLAMDRVAAAAQRREFIEDILASGRHLLQLINEILDLSKVEAGKLQFQPEPVELAHVVGEVTAIMGTAIAAKRLVLALAIDPDLGPVELDPVRLKQVLYNYLSNAVRFTPDGGLIELRIVAAGPTRFRVSVRDTGVGMAAADLPLLFVEFQQVGTVSVGGTGLGLALTKRIVEAQGGEVGVTSELGVGSEFYATLPRHAAVEQGPVDGLKLAAQ